MGGGIKITESKRKKEKKVVQKPTTVDLRLSEWRIQRLKNLTQWERQSAESNKFWILGEPSSYYC